MAAMSSPRPISGQPCGMSTGAVLINAIELSVRIEPATDTRLVAKPNLLL